MIAGGNWWRQRYRLCRRAGRLSRRIPTRASSRATARPTPEGDRVNAVAARTILPASTTGHHHGHAGKEAAIRVWATPDLESRLF